MHIAERGVHGRTYDVVRVPLLFSVCRKNVLPFEIVKAILEREKPERKSVQRMPRVPTHDRLTWTSGHYFHSEFEIDVQWSLASAGLTFQLSSEVRRPRECHTCRAPFALRQRQFAFTYCFLELLFALVDRDDRLKVAGSFQRLPTPRRRE